MNIERGINRIGTVFGFILGCLITFVVSVYAYEEKWFHRYEDKFEMVYLRRAIQYSTGENAKEIDPWVLASFEYFKEEGGNIFGYINKNYGYKVSLIDEFKKLYNHLRTISHCFLTIVFLFFIGFLPVKGIAKTINWIIMGFREETKALT